MRSSSVFQNELPLITLGDSTSSTSQLTKEANRTATIAFLIILIFVTSISSICSAMVAFVLYRTDLKHKRIIQYCYILAALIPTILLQVPIFKMMSAVNLINTLMGYIVVMCGADIVSIYIFGNYYKNIPKNVDKSAYLDGCDDYKIFFKIHLPQLKNAFITSMIIKGVYVYNEFCLANIYLLDKYRYPTITTELYSYLGPYNSNYSLICAACIIAILPIMLLFLVAQKKMYSGFSGK